MSFKVIDLAVAYESSFCSQNGSSEDSSNHKVVEIIAGVSQRYQQVRLCTKVKIAYIEGYCNSATDPYKNFVDLNNSGCDNNNRLLQGFQNY